MRKDGVFHESGEKSGAVSRLIKSSGILSFLDRLCSAVHDRLKNGFFARVFCSYREKIRFFPEKRRLNSSVRSLTGKIENSVLINAVRRFAEYLTICRLKVFGVFLFTFSAVSFILALALSLSKRIGFIPNSVYSKLLFCGIVLICSVPLISSRKTLLEAVSESRLLSRVLPAVGFDPEKASAEGERGKMIPSLFLGILFGGASFFVDPALIVAALFGLVFLYMVIVRPEFGVLCLLFFAPILPTKADTVLLAVVIVSYFLKLIRGKRNLVFETTDLFALIFCVLLIFGGFVSFSGESVAPALMRAFLMIGYFVIASVRHTREWLKKYTVSLVSSAILVALYGIVMYFIGSKVGPTWLDTSLFTDISGRAVSTLENPNMLGEYFVMIIPIAVSVIISGEFFKRSQLFFFTLVMGFCLILTWSRGAWLGLIFAVVILLFIWHKRALWLVFGGLIAFPLATFVMPASILNRFMSIGNMADTSTSYRVNIWRGAIRMIRDHLFTGIGIGEGAWGKVYPDYTLPGIEKAPHSHNLVMQITVEMGIIALIVFFAFLFFSYQSGFTMFKKLSDSPTVDPSGLLAKTNRSPGRIDPKLSIRMASAGPLCGIFGVFVQGFTDYSWYNYRVFMIFWLVLGLSAAFIKNGREYIPEPDVSDKDRESVSSEIDLSV